MGRLSKAMILDLLRQSNCVKTPTMDRNFKSVWVGEEMKQRINLAERKKRHT